MESEPQNPEFRINPENFHPCRDNEDMKRTRNSRVNPTTLTLCLRS